MEIDKDYNLIVGLRIRKIRESFHMTRATFSEKCDLSESFLTAVESGQKGITSKTLYKICTATNISADYFVCGKDHRFETNTNTILELINTMDKRSQESAIRILQEYAYAIYQLTNEEKL